MNGETRKLNNRCDKVNNVPDSVNQPENLDASTFSSITHAVVKSPEPNGLPKLTVEMGLPPTPPSRQLKIPDEGMMDAGYDSDFNMGPFVQDGVSAEAFVSMEEEAPVEPEPVLVLTDGGENRENTIPEIAQPVLTEAVIDVMKIVELRSELGKRGMSKNGLKAVLVERLKEAVAQNVPLLENRPDHEVANNAGDGFDGGAYWELLEADGGEVDESVMEVDGIRFRAPTEEEHISNHPDQPKKQNYSHQFDRSPFVTEERLLPEKNARGRFRKDAKGQFQYTKQTHTTTIPNIEYLIENNVGLDSHPADWFEVFFPKKQERKTHPKSVTMDE